MADEYTLDTEITEDMLLDDIPTLPGYVQLNTGAYVACLEKGFESKEIDGVRFFAVECTVVSVEESKEDGETGKPNQPGDKQSFLWDRTHAVAMTNFKQFIAPIAQKFSCRTVAEVFENSKGLEILLVGKNVYDAKKDRHNFRVKKVEVI